MSAEIPNKCDTNTALMSQIPLLSILANFNSLKCLSLKLKVIGSTSQNIGCNPNCIIGDIFVTHVIAGTITLSPSFRLYFSLIAATNNEFGTIVEFNQPLTVGDIVSIQYTNLVDAALELQDDIGTIEDLGTNTVQAGFGSTTRKVLRQLI